MNALEAKAMVQTLKEEGMPMEEIAKVLVSQNVSAGKTVSTKTKKVADEEDDILEAVDMSAGVANSEKIFGGLDARFIDWNGNLFMKKQGLGGRDGTAWCGVFAPVSTRKGKIIPEEAVAHMDTYIKLFQEHINACEAVKEWAENLVPIQIMPASQHKIGDVELPKK